MSRHSISLNASNGDEVKVVIGYDRPLDYVFCTVQRGEEILYSNLGDEHAGTFQQDVQYYKPVLDRLGITIPENIFTEVESDQASQIGNRIVMYSMNGAVIREIR